MTRAQLQSTWNAVDQKVTRDGVESLSRAEASFYRLHRFVVDLERGDLFTALECIWARSRGAGWKELLSVADVLREEGPPPVTNAIRKTAHVLNAHRLPADGRWSTFIHPLRRGLSGYDAVIRSARGRLWRIGERFGTRLDGGTAVVLPFRRSTS